MPRITLTIESRLDTVPLLGQSVAGICQGAGLTGIEANEVEVCVVEVVNNSIEHAYSNEPAHKVILEVDLGEDELVFEVLDWGQAADPERIHRDHSGAFDLDLDRPEDFSEGGRGLAIIQQVMDSFQYKPEGRPNRFRLTKRLRNESR